jgi:pre-rRNA-processing protein TSR3
MHDREPLHFDRRARVWILRDPKEAPSKCTLVPLRGRPDVSFLSFDVDRRYEVEGAVLLHCDGEPLSRADAARPLLVLDGAWRRVQTMMRRIDGRFVARSIPPGFETAYPRRSKTFEDPSTGLASIEALYLALLATGTRDESWLAAYRWKDEFLRLNAERIARLAELAEAQAPAVDGA